MYILKPVSLPTLVIFISVYYDGIILYHEDTLRADLVDLVMDSYKSISI